MRFRVALALGDTSSARAVAALARIARRDSPNRWIRTAVLSSCTQIADQLFAELTTGPIAIGPENTGDMQDLLQSLVAIVGSRNRPDEVDGLFDRMAANNGASIEGSRLDEAQRMVLALARGVRRSGGQIRIEPAPARPGAALVARLVQRAKSRVQDELTPEGAVRDAIDVLSTIDPDGSRELLLERLTPRQPLAVQVALVQAMAEGRSADVPDILLPRLRAFEPAVRAAAIRTLLSRVDWTKALLKSIQQRAAVGIGTGSIDPADRAPLLKHRDPEIARHCAGAVRCDRNGFARGP